ncbi:MAG: glycosyltransferase, partial [Paludibacter sp.]|nr:glycosyltransferase [Paludibacter sp.]
MHIIIIGTAYPYRGGLSAYNERLARQFQREGHEVEIITFTLQYPGFLFPGKTQFSSEPRPEELKITRMISSVNPFSWMKTGRKIKKKAPDKVIFCYWMAFMAPCFGTIARYAKNRKTKMIGLIHNMIPHEPTILDRLFPGYFVDAMDGFVAMAGSVVSDINSFDKKLKPKQLSPHPIYDHYGEKVDRSLAAMRLGLHEQNNYILFFGFIRHYKGLDLLLRAFADERLRKFPVKLIVAGEFYENPEPYLKLIKKFKLGNHVELRTKFIEDKDVKNYFSVADIVAQPYRSATQSGVSQIAYHYENPMLVTDVGGLAEIVPHNKVGYVVDVNPDKIADALVDFFANKRAEEFKFN